MSSAIAFVRRWLILLVVVSLAACGGNEGNVAQSTFKADSHDLLLKTYGVDEREALRIRKDAQRKRLWLLTLEDVRVYDSATKKLIRRIALPSWSVVSDACMPDMTLDSSGSALIVSNAHPILWRIHGDNFAIKEYEITLRGRESWAMGFGAIRFAADGTLFALTSLGNSLWEIDLAKSSANMIDFYHPPLEVCTLRSQF